MYQLVANGDVPDASYFNGLMNQSVIPCTSGTRPSSPTEGMVICETDTDRLLVYSGSAWMTVAYYGDGDSYTPALTGSAAPAMGNSIVLGRYWRFGSRVDVLIYIKIGSTFTSGAGGYEVTLPFDVNATYNRHSLSMTVFDASATAYYRGYAHVGDSSTASNARLLIHSTTANYVAMTNTTPVTLATNDLIEISGTYYV